MKGKRSVIYTEDFRENAVKLADSIGIRKACEQLKVNEVTLRKWRRRARESKTNTDKIAVPEKQPLDPQRELQRELQEQIQLNQACQQTIEFLVEENTALRQQCESYLKAISLISQR